ncbi:hypothetical protein [Methanothermococcus okinawensis]|uniref:Uncharacterized protein n=1 Tax=Methanothermococcus okinawensis (strain DSM 14208 / JCM 11175 / IH1) TaxID=647113 RepID=F8AK00_METOI|nr:hypothetical protein [Methanothermococcus okinawensis]AEH07356.1 hypothetical protein Metok_1391 [Methanothermococcus okinawensis IH1]
MIELRGKSAKELIKRIDNLNFGDEKEIYINTELSKNLVIELLENSNIEIIYLPKSKYERTNKKLIEALKDIGLEVKPITVKTGRPSKNEEIISKYLDKHPKEISELTGINLKTVEYHYYKLKNKV